MIIFASILFAISAIVIILFMLYYQKRKHLHKLEIQKIEENFTKEMLRSQIEMQDQTLRNVASELHDNFNPTLSVINISLASLLPKLSADDKEALYEAKSLVKQLMAEMKSLSSSLNSDHLMQIGFDRAFEKYVSYIKRSAIYEVSFTTDGNGHPLSPEKGIILFRMCQEILNNIIKHADATEIIIHIHYQETALSVEIKDNGKGFDKQKSTNIPSEKDSTGLGNLHKRALILGALLEIESAPGKGTRAIIRLQHK